MKPRISVTFTERQMRLLLKESKSLTVSLAEIVRQIVDEYFHVID